MTIKQLLQRTKKLYPNVNMDLLEKTSKHEYTLHTNVGDDDIYIDTRKDTSKSTFINFLHDIDNACDYVVGQTYVLCDAILMTFVECMEEWESKQRAKPTKDTH